MKYRVTHTNEFVYKTQVGLCYNEARLLPRNLSHQTVLSAGLHIDPTPDDHYERYDYFGNRTAYFSIEKPYEKLVVTATSEVQVEPQKPLEQDDRLAWEIARERLHNDRSEDVIEATQFALDSPMVKVDALLKEYADKSFLAGRPLDEAVNDLMQRIYSEYQYDPEFSTIATPLKEIMQQRRGVCQDFAHLAIGCLRSQGLAARYVSGYIETVPPPGKERLVGADASHAWFSVFHPGTGWIDFDPTNNQLPTERHITVAWGRDYADVTPLRGVAFGGGEHKLKVAVDVLAIG